MRGSAQLPGQPVAVHRRRLQLLLGLALQPAFRNDETGKYEDYRARVGVNPGTNINDPGDDRALRLPDIQQLNVQLRANLQPLAEA